MIKPEIKKEVIEDGNYYRKYVFDANDKNNFEQLWEQKTIDNKKYRISKTISKNSIYICNNIAICYSILGNSNLNSYEKAYEVSYNFLEDSIEARTLELDESGSCHGATNVAQEELYEHISKVLDGFLDVENDKVLDDFSLDAKKTYEQLISNLEMEKTYAI